MKLLFDLFPIILFFAVYKLYGALPVELIEWINLLPFMVLRPDETQDAILLATLVAIVASFLQVSLHWVKQRRFEKMHLVSLALITVFGGATLLLRDPVFIKWKPTILNWLFAAAFLASQFIGNKTLVERTMGHAITVPREIWGYLNLAWVLFFVGSGLANIYVAYSFSEETWVSFKLFGLLGLTVAFVFAQALYLARYMEVEEESQGDA